MHNDGLSITRAKFIATALAVLLTGYSAAKADTLLSGFEGTLDSAIGTPWKFYDASADPGDQLWQHSFVPEGATEGTQALRIAHFSGWTHGFNLAPTTVEDRTELANLFATHDALEFDLTTGPATAWRQIFVIVNSSVTNWSQVQIDIPQNATTTISLPLTNPDPTDPTKNWKQAAIDGGATATYWEIFIALQGADAAPTADFDLDMDVDGTDFLIQQRNIGNTNATPEQGDTNFDALVDSVDVDAWKGEFGRSSTNVVTTIDNIKFVGGAPAVSAIPEPATAVSGLVGVVLMAMAAARGRRPR